MILEAVFNMLFGVLKGILYLIPPLVIDIPAGVGMNVRGIFLTVKDFVPWATVVGIMTTSFVITNWRIVWNIMFKIWKALPLT